jgi:hypothetical protein
MRALLRWPRYLQFGIFKISSFEGILVAMVLVATEISALECQAFNIYFSQHSNNNN